MNRELILEKLTQTMVELFDVDPASVKMETTFEELKLTSIDAIDLVVELQRFTGRRVAEEGLRKVRTVGDIVTLVEAHLAEGASGPPPTP
jgi:acyl carrier protein